MCCTTKYHYGIHLLLLSALFLMSIMFAQCNTQLFHLGYHQPHPSWMLQVNSKASTTDDLSLSSYLLFLAVIRIYLWSSFGPSVQDLRKLEPVQQKTTRVVRGWNTYPLQRGWGKSFSMKKRQVWGNLVEDFRSLGEVTRKMEPSSSYWSLAVEGEARGINWNKRNLDWI